MRHQNLIPFLHQLLSSVLLQLLDRTRETIMGIEDTDKSWVSYFRVPFLTSGPQIRTQVRLQMAGDINQLEFGPIRSVTGSPHSRSTRKTASVLHWIMGILSQASKLSRDSNLIPLRICKQTSDFKAKLHPVLSKLPSNAQEELFPSTSWHSQSPSQCFAHDSSRLMHCVYAHAYLHI